MSGNALRTGSFGKNELRALFAKVGALCERLHQVEYSLGAEQVLLQGAGASDLQAAKQLAPAINHRLRELHRSIENGEGDAAIGALFEKQLTIAADPYSSVVSGESPQISFEKALVKFETLVNGIRFAKTRATYR